MKRVQQAQKIETIGTIVLLGILILSFIFMR